MRLVTVVERTIHDAQERGKPVGQEVLHAVAGWCEMHIESYGTNTLPGMLRREAEKEEEGE